MRISDWSSDVCSSDLLDDDQGVHRPSLLPLLAAVPARGDSAPRQFRPAVLPRGEFCGPSINGPLSSNQRTAGKIAGLQPPRSHQPVLQLGPAVRPWALPRTTTSE